MKNYEIIDMINELDKLADKRLPQKISYAITRNLMKLQQDYECYTKTLQKIMSRYIDYAEKDKSGNPIYNENGTPKIKDEKKLADFNTDVSALLNIDVDTELYYVDESFLDYDDEKYDVLTVKENFSLRKNLCNKSKEQEGIKVEVVED